MSVNDIETALATRLDRFSELGARVKFDFGDDRLFIDGTKSPAAMSHDDADADCTLIVTPDDFTKIMHGALDPTMAFMTGKIKLRGSTAIAMKLGALMK